ncbi:MAG TPA: GntR family transcriptional regulator [Candidatus Dormibacteraeota bacterium]|nr:GntR family transcriptional regulator [Candidatus Dormibacteraeota bacterium]
MPPGELDRSSGLPLYQQLADLLRAAIRQGVYAPGDQLPTEPALMEHFGVTRPIVRGAVAELRSEGLVSTAQGRGTYVREPACQPIVRVGGPWRRSGEFEGKTATFAEIEATARRPGVRYLQVGRTRAPAEAARRLGIEPGAPVAVRRRILFADGVPLQVATSWVPWELAEGTRLADSDCEPEGSYPHLEAAGHLIYTLEEEITARMPTPEERRLLQLPPGTPVLRMVRTARDADGRPLEVADTVNAADRYVWLYPYPYKGREAKTLTLRR